MLDTLSKFFNKVIANRLLAHAEDAALLHDAQNAFRPGRSTNQHIYIPSQTVRGRLRQGKAMYAFFLDLKKAYDTIWRDGLMFKLWNKGIRGKAWQYVRSMYAATTRAVRCGQHTSDWFDIDLSWHCTRKQAVHPLRHRASSSTSLWMTCSERWSGGSLPGGAAARAARGGAQPDARPAGCWCGRFRPPTSGRRRWRCPGGSPESPDVC
jgi:hypothetical protein